MGAGSDDSECSEVIFDIVLRKKIGKKGRKRGKREAKKKKKLLSYSGVSIVCAFTI